MTVVTMKDIARASGVSRPMVSLVLNGRAGELRVAETTRQRVLETAEKLGYCRNQLALSVVTGRSRTLAFISESMGIFNYTGRIQEGILNAVSTHGYTIKLYHLNGDRDQLVKSLREWQVCGAVFHISDYQLVAGIHRELDKLGIPVAMVNLKNGGETGFGITTDDETGAYDATIHLIRQGARKICHLTVKDEKPGSEYVLNRYNGYLRAMDEAGLPPMVVHASDDDQGAIDRLLRDKNKRPDGIFCISDIFGMWVERAAIRYGVSIPNDLKLIGFGDLDMANYAAVALSSVHQKYETMGFEAAEAIIRAVEDPECEIRKSVCNLKLPTSLIIRDSSVKPK